MEKELERLRDSLDLCITKSNQVTRTSSIAYSKSGRSYIGASIDSDTKITEISSEHAALTQSILSFDFKVYKIVTLTDNPILKEILSPLVGKVMVDYIIRTGNTLEYSIINTDGKLLFNIKDVRDLFPFYKPENKILTKTQRLEISENKIKLSNIEHIPSILKKYALLGIERNFPTSDNASGYGTAILTKDGTVYFGGQYSAFDKRMLVHSEMTTLLSACMEKNYDITHLGIVSTKYTDTPCNICGVCRQFISEMSIKLGLSIELHCFAKDTDISIMHTIDTYLPDSWTSKKW